MFTETKPALFLMMLDDICHKFDSNQIMKGKNREVAFNFMKICQSFSFLSKNYSGCTNRFFLSYRAYYVKNIYHNLIINF